ncbi:hypothetical protein jhhlp_006493 [Lomentospora prolificans]|uniref:Nitrogen permease regulator 3 n=1 Tax=Lomentospora prolificans TaxID=41688 RepID=A0A2N3N624_9PEZI|nr:hypothetical protein jhhlp_006493 [Lomentospora prolificans]
MSLPILPSPSNLVGVALVVNRTRDGPSLVFHYPPEISSEPIGQAPTDSIDDGIAHDDILLERLLQPERSLQPQGQGFHPGRSREDRLISNSGSQAPVPWGYVAGFPTGDLATLLSPGRPYHKRLFQVSLDSLYLVSCPVHVPENGIWKKTKKQSRSKSQSKKLGSSANLRDLESTSKIGGEQPPVVPPEDPSAGASEQKQQPAEEEEKVSSMTMFNVVFILNPKKHEVRDLVNALYSNITKKVNKAYKYCQQRSDFVWKESKQIIRLKDKARENKTPMRLLWKEILDASTLASSIQEIYQSVSQNRIVSFQLDTASGPLSLSMQLPVPFYIPDVGPDTETAQHGLWLTSANTYIPDEAFEEPGFLAKNFALLLMDGEKKIISQLQVDLDPTTIAMVEFVRLCKPTMSLYQIGQSNILSHSQVSKYAHHFISWRRAIAIPPLHARDVYFMSPNCNLNLLPRASQQWARTFPLAPPLTNFLADLSYAPRPYKSFCPSKAHRPTYLAMLAWLMRGGWVTQLCTFAYVVVWPEIIYEVEHQIEADELHGPKSSTSPGTQSASTLSPDHNSAQSPPPNATFPPLPQRKPPRPPTQSLLLSHAVRPSATSTSASSPFSSSSTPSAGSGPPTTVTEQIAEKARLERMATKAQREAAEKATAHARKPVPAPSSHPATNDAPHLAHLEPYVILDAGRATGKDSLYLDAIGRRFADPKTAAAWQRFWKYFDGRSALERIALQEDMKRKEVWNLLTAMSEYLLCVRHW